MALVILEGLAMSFWLLLVCVVGIANGPVNLVCFYEQDVQERVVELGLTTVEDIKSPGCTFRLRCSFPCWLSYLRWSIS